MNTNTQKNTLESVLITFYLLLLLSIIGTIQALYFKTMNSHISYAFSINLLILGLIVLAILIRSNINWVYILIFAIFAFVFFLISSLTTKIIPFKIPGNYVRMTIYSNQPESNGSSIFLYQRKDCVGSSFVNEGNYEDSSEYYSWRYLEIEGYIRDKGFCKNVNDWNWLFGIFTVFELVFEDIISIILLTFICFLFLYLKNVSISAFIEELFTRNEFNSVSEDSIQGFDLNKRRFITYCTLFLIVILLYNFNYLKM
jgi:hypothetical protein